MSDQSSAQTDTGINQTQDASGVQKRIDQLVAEREAEKAAKAALEKQLMDTTAQMAQLALAQQQAARPPPQAPVDPLAQFKDQMDPVAMQAIQAAVTETQRRMEAQYAPLFAQQAAQLAQIAVQSEAANIKGLPPEVAQRAAQLAAGWRARGLELLPGDAINFAYGEYQRGQLAKAAPTLGYNPANAQPSHIPGQPLPPPQPQARTLPANFDQLSRAQQNALLEQNGVLDAPL